jgi:hypothetical protein
LHNNHKKPTNQVTMMMKLFLTLVLCSLLALAVTAQNCTVCGTSENVFTNPNAKYDTVTCAALQSSVADIAANATECEAQFSTDRWEWLDVPSWCGCEDATASETCNICDDDEVFGFPNAIVPWEDEPEEYTCSEAVELARHLSDPTICSTLVATAAVKATCCRPKGVLCSVCPIPNTPYQAAAQYRGFSCEMLGQDIELLTTDQCTEYFSADSTYWMNWESFCGCDGYTAPKLCNLCGDGMKVVNPDAIAPWEDEVDTFTCAEADKLAGHVIDTTVCTDEVQTDAVKVACCGPSTDVSGASDKIVSVMGAIAAGVIGFLFVF